MSDWTWDVTFEVAFDTDPATMPSGGDWTDLSDRVRFVRTSQGTPEGGVCTLELNNRDRELDPTNSGSSYNLVPARPARVRVTYNSVTYDLFRGFTKTWRPMWPEQAQATVEVEIADVTRWLALFDTDVDLAAQNTHERINALLTAAGEPFPTMSDIGTGLVRLDAYERESANVLRTIIDTADAEDGLIFVAPSGDLTFRSRHETFNATSQVTVGPNGVKVQSVEPGFGLSELVNVARMELADGTVYEIPEVASTSIGKYGRHTEPIRDLPMPWYEQVGYGDWLVYRFEEPITRLSQLTLQARDGDALGSILPRGVGDLVTFEHNPPGSGTPTVEGTIGRVEHTVEGGSWRTVWDLEPYFGEGPWMQWYDDVTTSGETWLSDVATSGGTWGP